MFSISMRFNGGHVLTEPVWKTLPLHRLVPAAAKQGAFTLRKTACAWNSAPHIMYRRDLRRRDIDHLTYQKR